jgi:hypothetical protein
VLARAVTTSRLSIAKRKGTEEPRALNGVKYFMGKKRWRVRSRMERNV